MITEINTTEDVKIFAKQLMSEDLNFHPDDDFNDYINISDLTPTYNKEEADLRNVLIGRCFEICEKEGLDIYDFMYED